MRWPGLPVPFLPEKKVLGNKEALFLKDRRFYLERFMQKLVLYPFMFNEEEFLTFSRPTSGQILENLDKFKPLSI
jgi:hypothetical protein